MPKKDTVLSMFLDRIGKSLTNYKDKSAETQKQRDKANAEFDSPWVDVKMEDAAEPEKSDSLGMK